jgi:hypothetical protein
MIQVFMVVAALLAPAATAEEGPTNAYWPGDFESHLSGGIFSRDRGVVVSDEANATPGGSRSWKLVEGYQHLELLVPGESAIEIGFNAKAEARTVLLFKVVLPAEVEGGPTSTIDTEFIIEPSNDWKPYEIELQTGEPYPGPIVTELLITCYKPEDEAAYVDDLTIAFEAPPAATGAATGGEPIKLTADSLSHRTSLDAAELRGRTVDVSADVTYESHDGTVWAGVVFTLLAQREQGEAFAIDPAPRPHWVPLNLSAKPGESATATARYIIPDDVTSLSLVAQLQANAVNNPATVDNIRVAPVE